MTRVDEVAPDIFRISTFKAEYGMQFNQFLLRDDEPVLIHTGYKSMFPATLDAVVSIIDPASLKWIGFSHFEADECGSLNEWLQVAPQATAICSAVGAMVSVNDFADRPPLALNDNDVIVTGEHRLRFLATPHVPHCWDAGLFFEEKAKTLFCSDLFFHPGEPEPLTENEIVSRAAASIRGNLEGPMAKDMPYTPYTEQTLMRLAELKPQTLATMHGSSYRGDGGAAIRELTTVIKDALGPG